MVDAAKTSAVLRPGYSLILEIKDGQVNITIAQVVPRSVVAVQLGNFAQPEDFLVKFCGGVGVLGSNRNVLNLRHV